MNAFRLLLPLLTTLPLLGVEVTVLGINDMHANLDGMPRLATAVKAERAKEPELLLLSAGDNRSGNPVNDVNEVFPGWPMVDIMNRIGFDLSAIGNHEFDSGPDALREMVDAAEFRFVCANTYATRETRLHNYPYQIFEVKGVKVGVLGLIEVGGQGYPAIHPDYLKNFSFRHPEEVAQEYRWLRGRCDVLILLTHMGHEAEVGLAKQFPEADAIIGGHSHTLVRDGGMVGHVLVTQAKSKCAYLSRLVFDVQDGKVVSATAVTIDLSTYGPDAEIAALVDEYNDSPALKRELAVSVSDLDRDTLGTLYAEAQREEAGVQICIQNRGGVRVCHQPAGTLTVGDVYRMDPFGNKLVTLTLNGGEVEGMLIEATEDGHHGAPCVAGMTYTATLDHGTLTVHDMKLADGTPIEKDKEYTVVVNSFVSSLDTQPRRDKGITLNITAEEAMIHYLENHKRVDFGNKNNADITITPGTVFD